MRTQRRDATAILRQSATENAVLCCSAAAPPDVPIVRPDNRWFRGRAVKAGVLAGDDFAVLLFTSPVKIGFPALISLACESQRIA
jgi:hypothetical protein